MGKYNKENEHRNNKIFKELKKELIEMSKGGLSHIKSLKKDDKIVLLNRLR